MSSPLRLIKPDQERLSVEELLSLLHPDHLDRIDLKAKQMREAYHCPPTVPDYEAFTDLLFDFYSHYQLAFFNADPRRSPDRDATWRYIAYDFMAKNLTGYSGDMHSAERNSVTGREGGAIAVIDALAEGIAKLHKTTHLKGVFFDQIAPSDYDTQLRLATELLAKFQGAMFPGETLRPAFFYIGPNFEQLYQMFVNHIHELRRFTRQ